jgi:hypothetical protein
MSGAAWSLSLTPAIDSAALSIASHA